MWKLSPMAIRTREFTWLEQCVLVMYIGGGVVVVSCCDNVLIWLISFPASMQNRDLFRSHSKNVTCSTSIYCYLPVSTSIHQYPFAWVASLVYQYHPPVSTSSIYQCHLPVSLTGIYQYLLVITSIYQYRLVSTSNRYRIYPDLPVSPSTSQYFLAFTSIDQFLPVSTSIY